MNNEETFYQAIRRQSITRRGFLEYCSLAATPLGLDVGVAPKITWALKNKPRIPMVWAHGLECICCTKSFVRSAHPLVKDVTLSLTSLGYDDTLIVVAGDQAEEVLEDIIMQYNGKYILVVEGNPPLGEQGIFYISSGRPFIEKLKRVAARTSAAIAWGTCASWGCVQTTRPNPTQATPIDRVITDRPIIKVPGCPPILGTISTIITYTITFDRSPDVNRTGRPLMFYGRRIHDKCCRRARFDAGGFAQSQDNDTARRGYYLYKMGCRGPTTYSTCSSTHWNDGVSFPIQPGHGCLGCTESGFWGCGSLYSCVVDIPQIGTHSTADTVGLIALGVMAAAVGVHAVASTVDQRRRHSQ